MGATAKPDSWYAGFADWGMTRFGAKAHAFYESGALCEMTLALVGDADPEKIPPEDYCRNCLREIRRMHEEVT